MELLQLHYFCDTAKTENISATAKQYMVPPSAVSQSIKRLEQELGVNLFIRQSNRIRLSQRGKVFYEKISHGLSLLEEAQNELRAEEEKGILRVSIFINRRLVMRTVEKFSRLYPQVKIVTKYTVPPENEDFDLIITDTEPKSGHYISEKLIEEDILFAIHKSHPLAPAESMTAANLSAVSFVCINKGGSLYRLTERIGNDLGFSPHIVIFSDDPYYIRKCVELGLGASFIPALSWQGEFSKNILLKRVGAYTRTTYAYREKQKYFSKYAKIFLAMLQEEFSLQQPSK